MVKMREGEERYRKKPQFHHFCNKNIPARIFSLPAVNCYGIVLPA